ncbi:hypothetical protein TWF696_004241 [Orbilia brochopaga]|uniref:Tyrosine decarboxylase n=1 Tax=Orbilia brochopaga TaxID=3140254 RepID=A0AAV9V783_9PEZI
MPNPFAITEADFSALLQKIHKVVTEYYVSNPPSDIRPSVHRLQSVKPSEPPRQALQYPIGVQKTIDHLIEDVLPGVFAQSSPHFYGFVTGGVLPPALLADFLVSLMDLNVMVHLPNDSIHTTIEHHTIQLLCDLFQLPRSFVPGSVITTGATASNILGLACAREWALSQVDPELSVSRRGYVQAAARANLSPDGIGILCCSPHSSIAKAASIVGMGSDNVFDLCNPQRPWDFDIEALEGVLAKVKGPRWIIVGQLGEVNSGRFMGHMIYLRMLCDKYQCWLHIDAAFGLLARCVKEHDEATEGLADWNRVYNWCDGLELADSITADGHKLMNVPYDAGLFFTKHADILRRVCKNPGAAYLTTGESEIEALCNTGIENSRRFRALPLYASLTALGAQGYSSLIRRLILHARKIYEIIASDELSKVYELAVPNVEDIFMVVLFRARDDELNEKLAEKINATGKIWVSGTVWRRQKSVRIAVANWRVGLEVDGPGGVAIVRDVLKEVAGL